MFSSRFFILFSNIIKKKSGGSVFLSNFQHLIRKKSVFVLQVLMLCFVRKAMDFWYFTQQDMYWVDHILPEGDRRKKEDELLAAAEAEGEKVRYDGVVFIIGC